MTFEQAFGHSPCFGVRVAVVTIDPEVQCCIEESLRLYANMPAFKTDSPDFLALQLAKKHVNIAKDRPEKEVSQKDTDLAGDGAVGPSTALDMLPA